MYPGEGITLYDGSTASDGLRLVHGLRAVVGLSYTFTVGDVIIHKDRTTARLSLYILMMIC